MPSALRQLRASCAISKPATVANLAVASLGEGAERNTRIAPPQRVLAGARRRDKRKERGGTIDDATRLDDLVRRHLILRGMVLLYIPGQHKVLVGSDERVRVGWPVYDMQDVKELWLCGREVGAVAPHVSSSTRWK
mmetsp:Transcript_46259/g.153350  ORF Transcript_46259/g.153350 Transcript_46259/m.153350 type:complete len:136 (-) Transcript_46259:261-668(-)